MNNDESLFSIKRIFSLPRLHKDSYEVLMLIRVHIFIFILAILLIYASLFQETRKVFRLEWEFNIHLSILFAIIYYFTLYSYKKKGFDSLTFQYLDMLGKFFIVIILSLIIYFAKDPRTAWWVSYFFVLVLISQLSDFHWGYFILFTLSPSIIGFLFLTDEKFGYSTFHKSFPFFMALVSALLYYYQCRVQGNVYLIKANNMQLMNELNDLKINLERERISRDLHDSLGASLTGNVLYAEIAKEEFDKNPQKAKEMIEQIEYLSRDALVKMREAVYSIMEDRELLEDFSQYIVKKSQDLLKIKNIRLRFHCNPDINNKLSAKTKYHLYKVLGEWLTNVVRHSNASEVDLECSTSQDTLLFAIKDNGIGFNQNDKSIIGRGLKNINHRVKEIGGELSIISKRKKGSQLKITLPIES